jgi:hypothetical protein
MLTRRDFFRASAAAATCAALPARARAASAADTSFLFVFAQGGWDPTRVLATPFSNRNVAMEAAAERATAGGISYV